MPGRSRFLSAHSVKCVRYYTIKDDGSEIRNLSKCGECRTTIWLEEIDNYIKELPPTSWTKRGMWSPATKSSLTGYLSPRRSGLHEMDDLRRYGVAKESKIMNPIFDNGRSRVTLNAFGGISKQGGQAKKKQDRWVLGHPNNWPKTEQNYGLWERYLVEARTQKDTKANCVRQRSPAKATIPAAQLTSDRFNLQIKYCGGTWPKHLIASRQSFRRTFCAKKKAVRRRILVNNVRRPLDAALKTIPRV